jgi:hypothetical protein
MRTLMEEEQKPMISGFKESWVFPSFEPPETINVVDHQITYL